MFIIGTGRTRASGPPRYRKSGKFSSAAAARATASETASVALAPRVFLVGVPSNSISFLSMLAWSRAAGNGRSPKCAVVKTHVHLDCRIPARIQNFSGLNVPDAGARHTLPRRLDQFSQDEANPFNQIALQTGAQEEPVRAARDSDWQFGGGEHNLRDDSFGRVSDAGPDSCCFHRESRGSATSFSGSNDQSCRNGFDQRSDTRRALRCAGKNGENKLVSSIPRANADDV